MESTEGILIQGRAKKDEEAKHLEKANHKMTKIYYLFDIAKNNPLEESQE